MKENKITKEEALKFVRDYFKKKGWPNPDGLELYENALMMLSGVKFEPVNKKANPDNCDLIYTAEKVDELLKQAESDYVAHGAACKVAAAMLEQGAPLPPALASFFASALRGKNIPKKRKGAHQRKGFYKKHRIIMAVFALTEEGVTATKSPATEKFCGCDVVAEVLSMTPGNVASIWKNRPKKRPKKRPIKKPA